MTTPNLSDKLQLHAGLSALAEAPQDAITDRLASLYDAAAEWRGAHPLNEMQGLKAVAATVWVPLKRAFPDLERRDLIVAGGTYEDRHYVAMIGRHCGTFHADWLGIPATGRPVFIRYGEVHEVRSGRIVQSTCLWDILDLVRQAGLWPLAPSLGVEGLWPGPITGDGLRFSNADPDQSAASIAQTLAMHATLGAYDDRGGTGRDGLLAMPQKEHWHPRMMWYGPSGIGATRGLEGFVDDHQLPFRIAFPNREGGRHYIRIGDGPYSVTGGWPSVVATHEGEFLGLGPTGRAVTMRVMDFYLHHEGLIRENWVPLDVLDLLRQMGVDVLARMRRLRRPGA